VNDEGGDVNVAFDHDHTDLQSKSNTIPGVAKTFKMRGQPWALIVDENYGEGSAREHAALQPRFYGEKLTFNCQTLMLNWSGRMCHDCCSILCSHSRDQLESEPDLFTTVRESFSILIQF